MVEIEIAFPTSPDFVRVEQIVDAACAAIGLTTQFKSTLRQYPGCVHWHLRRDKQKGTLEMTLWPEAGRLWFKVGENRRAAWIEEAVAQLTAEMERRFQF